VIVGDKLLWASNEESADTVNNTRRILIVEDDLPMRKLLEAVLQEAGFEVTAAADGSSALDVLQSNGLPHLVVLDLGLPGMDGFALSERIKRMGDVPIVILSGDTSDESKIRGIQNYAEDYITKPFNVKEVLARIQRILSRITDTSYANGPMLAVDGNLTVDFANNRVLLGGEEVTLTPTETNLLHVLVRNQGQIVSASTLIARVWPNEEVYEETLRVHMHRLRRKIEHQAGNQYIHTERGAGYSFHLPADHISQ
jgi:DNA-binding response OmpR family regulator